MSDKPKNVFRIDIEPSEENPDRHPTHGWQVRIKRQKEQHTKYFSDKRHGGREEALEKAVAYRDELLEELPDPMDPVQRSAEARSKTGVIGLNFCWKDDGSGTPKPYVQLSWLEGDGFGVPLPSSFQQKLRPMTPVLERASAERCTGSIEIGRAHV